MLLPYIFVSGLAHVVPIDNGMSLCLIFKWLMLLQLFGCMADVIAIWQM